MHFLPFYIFTVSISESGGTGIRIYSCKSDEEDEWYGGFPDAGTCGQKGKTDMKKERVFSLKGMITKIFHRWYLVLLCGLLFACLFGGYEWHKKTQEMNAAEAANESDEANKNSTSSDFTSEEDLVMKSLRQKDDYLSNSIMSQIDPNNEGVATVLFSVSVDETDQEAENEGSSMSVTDAGNSGTSYSSDSNEGSISADTSSASSSDNEMIVVSSSMKEEDTILQVYMSRILSNIDWTEMAEKLDTEPEYLNQLVSVTESDEVSAQIQIKVIYPDEDGAAEILDYLIDQIQQQKDEVVSETQSHTIAFRSKTKSTIVDSSLFGWMNSRINEMNNLMNSLDTFNTAVNAISPSDTNTVSVITRNDVIKSSAKYGVIGFVIGVILWIILGMAYLLIRGRVVSADDFSKQYDMKRLGVLGGKRSKKRQAGTENEMYQIAVLRIRHQMQESGKIAVVSDLDTDSFREVKQGLEDAEKAITDAGSVNSYFCISRPEDDPDALQKLEEADGAVIVAREDRTRYTEMDRVLQTVGECGMPVLGCIVGEA